MYTRDRDECNAKQGKVSDPDAVGAFNYCQAKIWGNREAGVTGTKKVLQDQVSLLCKSMQAAASPCDKSRLDFTTQSPHQP
jgi:hypothetical protein